MEVYITKANASKIVRRLVFSKLELSGTLYRDIAEKYSCGMNVFEYALRPIEQEKILDWMYGKFNKQELLAYRKLMEHPSEFANEIYVKYPHIREDTYWWVFEEDKKPAYHTNLECPRLHSKFKNYRIPSSVRFKGVLKGKHFETIDDAILTNEEKLIVKINVDRYRAWWKDQGGLLYKKDVTAFLKEVNRIFDPEPPVRNISEFELSNSGVDNLNNFSLKEIVLEIDKLIYEIDKYRNRGDKERIILNKYVRWRYNSSDFKDNDTGYTNDEIRSVLKDFYKRFKQPMIYLLKECYRRFNNPDLKMDESLAVQLGFAPCNCQLAMQQEQEKRNNELKELVYEMDCESDLAMQLMNEADEEYELELYMEALRYEELISGGKAHLLNDL